MLYESNRLKYFQHKYGILIMCIVLLGVAVFPLFTPDTVTKLNLLVVVVTFIFSGICFYIFSKSTSNWRIVAINRARIVVDEKDGEREYSWLDVVSIDLNRLTGVYTLQLKNGQTIFFGAYGITNLLTGDTSEMGVIINKMKRDLSI